MQATSVYNIPPTGTLVYINAADRHPTETPSYFRIGSGVILDNSAVGHISSQTIVKNIIFQNLIPTISTGQNDRWMYTVNGTTFIAVFASGLYDAFQLEASLLAELQTRNAGFNVVYDSASKKYTITVPAGVSFSMLRPVEAEQMPQTPFREGSPYARFLSMIGFWEQAGLTYVGATTITSQNPVELGCSSYLDVCLSSSTTTVLSTSPYGNEKLLVRFPLQGSYGDVVHYQPDGLTSDLNLNSLEGSYVQLRDAWRNTVQLPHNAKFSIELLILPGGLSSF